MNILNLNDRTQNISLAFCMASTRCHAGLKGLTNKDHPCEEKQVLDNRLWSKTMCVHISKLIYKKINFEYKTTIQVHLSENKSFEDSCLAIHNRNACGLFSK